MENSVLRAVLSYTEGGKRSHYFVFQESSHEPLYSLSGFPQYLKEDLDEVNKSSEAFRK